MGILVKPSLPAFVLLFGLLFLQAVFYFLGVPWSRGATLIFYSASVFLVFWCAWTTRLSIRRLNKLDAYFFLFVLMVIVSLGTSTLTNGHNERLWGYLVFMVIAPYVLGRTFSKLDESVKLQQFITIAGLAILPILLIDRLILTVLEGGRFPFFGMDHSPLLIGSLLSLTLISLHLHLLYSHVLHRGTQTTARYASLAIATLFLVWVSARGWLFVGIVGCIVVTMTVRHSGLVKKMAVLAGILTTVALSLTWLPDIDPRFGPVYSIARSSFAKEKHLMLGASTLVLGASTPVLGASTPVLGASTPVLGEASCQPFEKGNDSIAMRWVLYKEAIEMFLQKPWYGVGAGAFGRYSCTGFGGFPHSTALQVLSELGVVGIGVFSALILLTLNSLIAKIRTAKCNAEALSRIFLLAFFINFLIADQIYGNYFMALAVWLLIGIAGSTLGNTGLEDKPDV